MSSATWSVGRRRDRHREGARSCTRPTGLSGLCGGSGSGSAVIRAASGPAGARRRRDRFEGRWADARTCPQRLRGRATLEWSWPRRVGRHSPSRTASPRCRRTRAHHERGDQADRSSLDRPWNDVWTSNTPSLAMPSVRSWSAISDLLSGFCSVRLRERLIEASIRAALPTLQALARAATQCGDRRGLPACCFAADIQYTE